jgi:hypothetical protein
VKSDSREAQGTKIVSILNHHQVTSGPLNVKGPSVLALVGSVWALVQAETLAAAELSGGAPVKCPDRGALGEDC